VIGNHKPVLRNVDEAARRRFNVVPFVHKPAKPDPDLEAKLKAEWPGILRWAIDG
jgi:putative DNA primase/helicase